MNLGAIGICIVTAALNAAAQLILKHFFSLHPLHLSVKVLWWTARQPMVIAGVGIQVLGMIAWWMVLSRLPLSVGFPLTVGMIYAFVAVGAVVMLGESVGLKMLIGIGLIAAGSLLVGS